MMPWRANPRRVPKRLGGKEGAGGLPQLRRCSLAVSVG